MVPETIIDEKDKLERSEKSLEAANEASRTVRSLYFTFLALGAYTGVIIASTTDEQLLRVSPVTLPLIGLPLPIKGFYIFVPWLFLVFHFYLIIHLTMLATKLRVFERLADALLDEELATLLKERLINFPFAHMLIGKRHDKLLGRLLTMIVWVTMMALPLFLLLWAQVAFLPYHSESITWVQRAAVLVDILILVVFWTRIMSPQRDRTDTGKHPPKSIWNLIRQLKSGGWKAALELCREVRIPINNGTIVMIAAVLCALFISLTLAKVPDSLSEAEDSFFDSRLDLQEKLLTVNEPSTKIINILREEDSVLLEEALREVLGVILRNRDLRYALLQKSNLPKADLRSAQLQYANFEEAKLQGANLTDAKLQGANLKANLQGAILIDANLQGAILEGAQLKGAVMIRTQLQGVVLRGAQLQGQDFKNAKLQGAIFSSAKLQGAFLRSASLQGAYMQNAQLQGADLGGAKLQGANLTSAQLQGVDLGGAKLQGANLTNAQLQGAILTNAQLQGAELSGAQLQGAQLRWASVGSANFKDSNLDYADLRNIDRRSLTEEQYKQFTMQLEGEIKNEEIKRSILQKLKSAIGKKDTLKDAKIDNLKCLSNEMDLFFNCRSEDSIAEHQNDLSHYLIEELACSDPHVARGVIRRILGSYDIRMVKDLLKTECSELKTEMQNLPEDIKDELEKIIKEDRIQTD